MDVYPKRLRSAGEGQEPSPLSAVGIPKFNLGEQALNRVKTCGTWLYKDARASDMRGIQKLNFTHVDTVLCGEKLKIARAR